VNTNSLNIQLNVFCSDFMTDDTIQKIIDAALKVFGEKGYKGATTRTIAEKAGFSELTLFRKFKTKENLFDMALVQSIIKFKKEFQSILLEDESKDPEVFLRTLIRNMERITEDNFEFIHLINNEKSESSDPFKEEIINLLTNYIKKNISSSKIDYKAFSITIFMVTYGISLSKYRGETFINQEKILEGFIDNSLVII
jgi:AcrR family transcriptional regulator